VLFVGNDLLSFSPNPYRDRWGREDGERHAREYIASFSVWAFSLEEVAQSVRRQLAISRALLHSGLETADYFQARIDIFRQWFARELDWTGYDRYGKKAETAES
jgi:hypothetical protein